MILGDIIIIFLFQIMILKIISRLNYFKEISIFEYLLSDNIIKFYILISAVINNYNLLIF